jgi:hypothetical protein
MEFTEAKVFWIQIYWKPDPDPGLVLNPDPDLISQKSKRKFDGTFLDLHAGLLHSKRNLQPFRGNI